MSIRAEQQENPLTYGGVRQQSGNGTRYLKQDAVSGMMFLAMTVGRY